MSLQAMVWVLDECEVDVAGQRLVLLSLANYSYDATPPFRAFPSVASLAKAARMSERNTQYSLRGLEKNGDITRRGTSEYGTYIYEFGGGANLAPAQSTAPEPMKVNERNTHLLGSGAIQDNNVSQIAPLDLTVEQNEVLRVLRAVADSKGLEPPRIDLVLKAMQSYPTADALQEAEALEAWASNPKKTFGNVNMTFRMWLRRAVQRQEQEPKSTMKEEQMETVKKIREEFGW